MVSKAESVTNCNGFNRCTLTSVARSLVFVECKPDGAATATGTGRLIH